MAFLSDEELIALAQSEDNVDYTFLGKVGKFLNQYDIKPSDSDIVPSYDLYWLYLKWHKKQKGKPLKPDAFFKTIAKVFKKYRGKTKRYFYCEKQHIKLSIRDRASLRKYLKQKYESIRQKKAQRSKTSKFSERIQSQS